MIFDIPAKTNLKGGIAMNPHLEAIAKAYDRGIDCGRQGIDLYKNLPEHIINAPGFKQWEAASAADGGDSGRKEIYDFLSPGADMKFIDLGCCLNLMINGYDQWPSLYHGVDISEKTIQLLNEFAANNNLTVGALYRGSVDKTPFGDNFFDIGACIGVLEYFERDFVENALAEARRIIKPNGRFVLDIPDIGDPVYRVMALVEAHLGRPDKFNMTSRAFEEILKNYFEIVNKIDGAMILYFLSRK